MSLLLRALRALRAPILLLGSAALLVVTGCSESVESLEDVAGDSPGVVRVRVTEQDGDDHIPLTTIPKTVRIEMETGATSDQVLSVFDAYDEAIDDGDVGAMEVVLAGPKRTTLASGAQVHVGRTEVDDLVAAQADDGVLAYRHEANPVLPSVEVEIARSDFDAVVSAADRYRDADEIDLVTVRSGDFVVIRDEVNEDLRVTDARERLALQVAARFRLIGATVSGRGPLELLVAADDVMPVREFARRHPDAATVRRVVVVAGQPGGAGSQR